MKLNCSYCKKEFQAKESNHRKYCSLHCMKEENYAEYIIKWKNEEVDGVRGNTSTSRYIRRYLFEKYNNKCSKCGWSKINEYTNTIPLELEHIDGDYSNNKENNLTLLCPSCHSLTATWKGANKKKKRLEGRDRSKYYRGS